MSLDPLVGEPADGQGGHGRGEQQDRQPRGQHAGHELAQLDPEIGEQRGQRAEMHGRVEGQALVGPAEDVGNQDQMPRRRHGKELRDALDDPEHERLRVGQPMISSPAEF